MPKKKTKKSKKRVTPTIEEVKEPFKFQISLAKLRRLIHLAEWDEIAGCNPLTQERRNLCNAINALSDREMCEMVAIGYTGRGSKFDSIEQAVEDMAPNMKYNFLGKFMSRYLSRGMSMVPRNLFPDAESTTGGH